MANFPAIVDLNVGGVQYTTSLSTLTAEPNSLLGEMFTGKQDISQDSQVCFFIKYLSIIVHYSDQSYALIVLGMSAQNIHLCKTNVFVIFLWYERISYRYCHCNAFAGLVSTLNDSWLRFSYSCFLFPITLFFRCS